MRHGHIRRRVLPSLGKSENETPAFVKAMVNTGAPVQAAVPQVGKVALSKAATSAGQKAKTQAAAKKKAVTSTKKK